MSASVEGRGPAPAREAGTGTLDRGRTALPGVGLVLRRARWVLLGALLGLAVGVGVVLVRPPVYESTAVLTVTTTVPQEPVELSRAAQALARVATAPGVVSESLRAAGLEDAAQAPRRWLEVQAAPNAPLISVTGAAADARTAQSVARTVADALADVPVGESRAVLAAAPQRPDGPATPRWFTPAATTALGAALSLVLAATLPERRRSRR